MKATLTILPPTKDINRPSFKIEVLWTKDESLGQFDPSAHNGWDRDIKTLKSGDRKFTRRSGNEEATWEETRVAQQRWLNDVMGVPVKLEFAKNSSFLVRSCELMKG